MTRPPFEVSTATQLRAQSHGDDGRRWLAELDRRIRTLERQWQVQAETSLIGGSESLVLKAVRTDGTPAILKIGLPGSSDLGREAEILRLADGRGYAKMFGYDASHNALLMEDAGQPLATLELSVRAQLEHLCTTLLVAWLPLDEPRTYMTGAEKARYLARYIPDCWQALKRPCGRALIDLALTYAKDRERAFEPSRCVLVHGDPHEYNLLAHTRGIGGDQVIAESGCKFVDPDGLYAEPGYDLGVLMRGFDDELLAGDALKLGRARCDFLAGQTGVDSLSIWQWGMIERVSTGLHQMEIGLEEPGRVTLQVAEKWFTG